MPDTEPLKSPIDDDGQRALRIMAVALSDIHFVGHTETSRELPPASSATHAHELLTKAAHVLKLRGLARDADASELDELDQETGSVHLVAVQDEVGREWLQVLAEQVRAG